VIQKACNKCGWFSEKLIQQRQCPYCGKKDLTLNRIINILMGLLFVVGAVGMSMYTVYFLFNWNSL